MNRAGAAEGEQRHSAVVHAAVGGVRPRRRRHGFGHHAENAARGLGRGKIERPRELPPDLDL